MLKISFIFFLAVLTLSAAAQNKRDSLQIELLDSLSTNFMQAKNIDSALKYRLKLIDIAKNSKGLNEEWRRNKLSLTLQKTARTYLSIGIPEMAITYLAEQRPFIDNPVQLSSYYKNRSDALRMYAQSGAGKIDSAKFYYDSLSSMCKKGSPEACTNLIALDLSFSDYYSSQGNINDAAAYVDDAQLLAPKYADTVLHSQVSFMSGAVYFQKGAFSKALPNLLAAETFAKQWDEGLYVELLRNIAQCYGKLGDYKNAYVYYDKFAPLRDSIYVKAAEKSIAEAEASYQNKSKQQKIDVLSAENTIKNITIKNAERQKWFYIIGIALLALVITSLIIIYRNKQKSSRLLQQKNDEMNLLNEHLEKANHTKAKLFSIISHDLRSPVSRVYQFLTLQKANPALLSEAQKQEYNEKITGAAGAVLETMEDLLIWSKTQMQQFTATIENVQAAETANGVSELLHPQLDAKHITLKKDIPESLYLHTDRNIVTVILRNLLQNAINHSPENSSIQIAAYKENNAVVFSVADKGAGMPAHAIKALTEKSTVINSDRTGLGLTIVREMADILHATIEAGSNGDVGTLIKIKLPA